MNEEYNVPGLEKGLQILELLTSKGDWMTLKEVTSELQITTTMAFRIFATLVRMGYVEYNDREKSYRPSRKILQMAYQTLGEFDVKDKVIPTLRRLRDRVKESVFFGVLGQEKGIFVEQSLGLYPFKFVVTPGSTFELHSSAGGKAILAYVDDSLREHYLGRMNFERYTHTTITSRRAFLNELEKVKLQGYAIDNEESLLGVVCVGVPLLNYDNQVVGAIWVSGPSARFEGGLMEEIRDILIEECGELSEKLGYTKRKKEL
ncbi:MAG: IclR family transcriptional regulator [Phocaeicola sp.]